MDELEARLKRDAAQIQAATSPELQARLAASLRAVHAVGPAIDRQRVHKSTKPSTQDWIPATTQDSSWFASGLTGLAALALVILLVNFKQQGEPESGSPTTASNLSSQVAEIPGDWDVTGNFTLNVKPADLTRTLDQELIDLQSDLEKARNGVERDIRFAF